MNLRDIITDVGTRQLSHTKLWNNVANFVGTSAFIYEVYKRGLTDWLLLIYLGAVGGSAIASKFLSFKYGGGNEQNNKSA